jgi:N-acylglucosamine 2-epimerase
VTQAIGPNGEWINHFDGRTFNLGHAIETTWFILQEARYRRNDPGLIRGSTTMLD